MAQFPKIQLTQLGKNIILAGQNKQKVTFTKVEIGDGLLDGQSVDDMTALVHSVMSLPLQNFLNNGDGSARLRFVLDNNNLAKGFFNREIGVFAKIDDGEEQLYAYTNAGNLADYIPGKESPISSKIINLHIIVGNAMNLTIVAENSAYVTKLDMDSHKAAVEIDHPDASVTTPKIRDGAVTSAKIAERAIEKKHLRKGGIVAGDIGAYSKEDVNKLLDDHRKKTSLDHPDGSVLKKHLGFTVYDKSETDARLNTKANANHGYHVPSPEAANNTRFLRNDNTWQPITAGNIGVYTKGETNNLLNTKAPLASPALTGVPTAPTAGRGTNSTQLATTAFVAQAVAALVNSAPSALDTLQELAKALGNDANFATTMTNALAGKLGKSERAADSAKLENRNLQWILEQIKASKTGIVAGNLEQNGWVKFANGLIVQWGVWGNLKIDQVDKLVNFHMPFPGSCFIALLTLQAETFVSGANNVYVKKGSLTRTGLTIIPDYSAEIIFSDVFYVALGR